LNSFNFSIQKKLKFHTMRKVLFVLAVSAALYACGGGSAESTTPVSNNEENKNSQIGGEAPATAPSATAGDSAAKPAEAAPAAGNGKELIAKSDCLTCHKEDAKVIGPSYKEVAKKYEASDANVKLLAGKIIAGGQGVWGEIPMSAHPQVSQADAESMVRYILSLK
jgi:cytochrome c